MFKNKGSNQQAFYPSSVRLVDTQSREYEREYSSQFPPLYIRVGDTLKWNAEFKILPSNNVSKVYFIPEGSESRLRNCR